MEQSSDPLVFLVISSAVANLSFMGSVVSDHLARQEAARILVESWRDGKVETLNAKDQVKTAAVFILKRANAHASHFSYYIPTTDTHCPCMSSWWNQDFLESFYRENHSLD